MKNFSVMQLSELGQHLDPVKSDLEQQLQVGKVLGLNKNNYYARRLFGQLEPSLFVYILEQLTLSDEVHKLLWINSYLKTHPFYKEDGDPLLIYFYRLTMVRLNQLIAKVQGRYWSAEDTVNFFYQNTSGCVDGFALAMKNLSKGYLHRVIRKLGYHLILYTYSSDKQNYDLQLTQNNDSRYKKLIVIQDLKTVYAFVYQKYSHTVPFNSRSPSPEIVKKKKRCSICRLDNENLIENAFCFHLYCKYCLKNYLNFEEINSIAICPIKQCYAKLLKGMIQRQINPTFVKKEIPRQSIKPIKKPQQQSTPPPAQRNSIERVSMEKRVVEDNPYLRKQRQIQEQQMKKSESKQLNAFPKFKAVGNELFCSICLLEMEENKKGRNICLECQMNK